MDAGSRMLKELQGMTRFCIAGDEGGDYVDQGEEREVSVGTSSGSTMIWTHNCSPNGCPSGVYACQVL